MSLLTSRQFSLLREALRLYVEETGEYVPGNLAKANRILVRLGEDQPLTKDECNL